jgi:hypothetical protein
MATEDSLKELDDWLAKQKEMYEAGYISAKQLHEAEMDHAAGIRGYTAALKQSISQLGTSSKETAMTMLKGQESSATFGKTVEAGADAVATYASKFGPAGKALGMLTKGMAALNTAALKQSKDLFDQYQKLSQVGVVGGKAMDEVYEKMREFGYTPDQLGSLNRVLTENSKTLGKFYGSALEGSRVMGKASAGFAEQRESLRAMGLTVDDLNDAMAGYMAQEGAMGKLRGKSDKDLTAGTIAYLKELDQITKLTGMSRQEQQDVREQALNIETFYAGLQDLDDKQREQAMKAYNIALSKGGPKMAAEFAANFNGVITGSSDLMLATGGESMKYFSKEFFKSGGTAEGAMQGVAKAIDPAVMELNKNVSQIGGSFGPSLRSMTEFKEGVATIATDVKTVAKEQKDQLAGVDSATASQAKIAENQLKTGQRSADFTQMMVPASTKMHKFATDVTEWVSRALPGASSGGVLGVGARNTSGGAVPSGGGGTSATPASAPASGGGGARGGGGGGGGGGGPSATPASDGSGSNRGAVAPSSSGGANTRSASLGGDLDSLINFKGGSGSRDHWDSLNPNFQQAMLSTIKEYISLGGSKLNLESGFRSDEEQLSLYKRWLKGQPPGVKTAKDPGAIATYDGVTTPALPVSLGGIGNSHGKGVAIDAGMQAADIARKVDLDKYGLVWGGNAGWSKPDPVHIQSKISAEKGGIFSGPNGGYAATMSGEGAVVPLENNSGNFVKLFQEMAQANEQMVQLLEETLELQESIASATKNTADSSGKMLHYAQG